MGSCCEGHDHVVLMRTAEGFWKFGLGKPLYVQSLGGCFGSLRTWLLRTVQMMEVWLVKFQRICGSGQLGLKNLLWISREQNHWSEALALPGYSWYKAMPHAQFQPLDEVVRWLPALILQSWEALDLLGFSAGLLQRNISNLSQHCSLPPRSTRV